jgi:lambda family phage tail tape measure protein
MADLTYQATLDDKISPALAKIQQQTNKTAEAFGKFKSALAGLAIGAAIKSALSYADAISDISDATGIAIENVLGFSKAVSAAGGNSEKAQAALVKFNLTLAEAASGGLAAQDAFGQIGVSLNDLRTLSEQDLLKKVLDGLNGIDDLSKRAKLSTEIFGKTLKGVNLKGLTDQYSAASAASIKYAEDIRKAAELQDKLDAAFSTLKLSILKAIEPLVTFLNNLDPAKVDKFINAVVQLGGAAVAIVGLTKALEGLAKVLGYVGGAVALGLAGFTSLGKTAAILTWQFGKATAAFAAASGVVAKLGQVWITVSTLFTKRLGFLIAGIAQVAAGFAAVGLAVVGINELIKLAFDVDPIDSMATKLENLVTSMFPSLAAAINKVGEALGMGPAPSQKKSESDKKVAEDKLKIDEAQKRAAEEKAKVEREVTDALAKQRKEIQQISVDFGKILDDRAEQLQLETSLIGKSEQQKELAMALADLNKKVADEVANITKAQAALTEEQKRGGLSGEYDKQIIKVQELAKAEQERLTKLVEGLQAAKSAEELRRFGIQQEYDLQDKLTALERERADLTLTDIERKYRDIARAADDSAKAAIRAEEARRGSPLSAKEVEEYYAKARAGTVRLIDAQKKLYDQSRTFDTGWNKAFKNYVDNARNAAQQAERLFEKFTSGIEDLLVDFAKTGKFEWKGFVDSMLEELLRSQIKQTMASLMEMPNPFSGSGGNVGGLFGGLFEGLLGGSGAQRGQSAATPMFVYDVAGGGGAGGMMGGAGGLFGGGAKTGSGSGGGFLSGIGDKISGLFGGGPEQVAGPGTPEGGGFFDSITSSIGDFFSGFGGPEQVAGPGMGSGGGFLDTVTSGIGDFFGGGGDSGGGSFLGDIGSSIGDFFGGFFANGGSIPAGKFGVVGERGPEFIGGPANITPMGGMSNVTYNINAVDAASFKALVAADPGFIHAVAMKGAGGIPMGR